MTCRLYPYTNRYILITFEINNSQKNELNDFELISMTFTIKFLFEIRVLSSNSCSFKDFILLVF